MVAPFHISLSETKVSLEILHFKMKCYLKYSTIKDFMKACKIVPKLRCNKIRNKKNYDIRLAGVIVILHSKKIELLLNLR